MLTTMLVKSDPEANNNKFYEVTLHDDNRVTSRYGRVGESGANGKGGSGRSAYDRLVGEKKRKGYVEVQLVADAKVAKNGVDNTLFEELAVQQIANNNPLLGNLVRSLVKQNVHDILSGTTLSYDKSSGLFATPLGLVTRESIQVARDLLADYQKELEGNKNDRVLNGMLAQYMTLVPINVGRSRYDWRTVMPNLYYVSKQVEILDSLEASLDTYYATAKQQIEATKPDVFRLNMSLAPDDEVRRVKQLYDTTRQRMHESSGLEVKAVWNMSIDAMTRSFQEDGAKLQPVWELWHGTRTPNLLSIMSKGFVVPKTAAHGRMFGDGVYFSDQATKSLNYAYGTWSGSERNASCFMLLCKVGMGNMYVPTGTLRSIPKGYDSCFAKAGESGVRNNEMIVYRTSQACITHLIQFGGQNA